MHKVNIHTSPLSKREKEIVIKLAQGYTAHQVADQLYISYHTVTSHKRNIYAKTGMTTLPQIGVYAERMGWLQDINFVPASLHP